MKLFYAATSPFVRKVMVVLHETGQLGDVTIEPTVVTPLAPAQSILSKNPLSKVPALERPEGTTLYDSRVICAYLDDRAKAGLYPARPALWDAMTLEATADGIMDAAILMVYESRLRPEDIRWQDWVEGQWSKVSRAISMLNDRWMGHLAGPVDIGQIAVGCALGYVSFRLGDRNWQQGNDALAAWFEAFDARPSMIATRPPEA